MYESINLSVQDKSSQTDRTRLIVPIISYYVAIVCIILDMI